MSKNTSEDKDGLPLVVRGAIFAVKQIGMPAFVGIIVIWIFLSNATDRQKEEFIDYWILLKSANHSYFYIILGILLLLIVVQNIYFRKLLEIRKQENNRIGEEKSLLQQALLPNNDLTSSDN